MTEHSEASFVSTVDHVTTSLVARAKRLDNDAWRRLVTTYSRLVCFWCRKKLPQSADVEGVAQDVFLAAAVGINKFDGNSKAFRNWLRTITYRQVANHWRREQDEPQARGGSAAKVLLNEIPSSEIDEGYDKPSTIEIEQENSLLYSGLIENIRHHFSDQTWTAFWQVVIDGRDPSHVAADLGISRGAVYTAKSRVLKKLREDLSFDEM